MSESPTPLLPDDDQTRDRLRAALAVCCAIALVLAGTVVPAMSGGGTGQSPLASVMPHPDANPYEQPGAGGANAPGALGALNPTDSTSVGGSLASDENAFQSRNAETHFTVQSSDPAYWRTGAYDTYTGSGWDRSGDRQPYEGSLDREDGIRGERVEYRVTLDRSATALPSVWRADSVSQIETDSLFVTDRGAFVSDDPVPAGTTYSGVSYRPPEDPTVLETAGRDYPQAVERRYTGLPEETDQEIGRFTANLTRDADSPYESATRIESWLEANKEYSLNVSQPGEDVASEFIFEMDAGYCEYFATTMTVMLRSQGIPARYVVGYSTGQQVGENTYQVRGLNAHAWVEVYFPDVGWVKFDPTPGADRLEAEQSAVENQTGASDYEPTESGSPGEEFSANESADESTADSGDATATDDPSNTEGTVTDDATPTPGDPPTEGETTTTSESDRTTTTTTGDGDGGDDDSRDDPDQPTSDGDYAVELNRTPVPGLTVEATVLSNGTPAADVPVVFNGEFVGYTGVRGTVVGEVPYARNLTITVGEEPMRNAARAFDVASSPEQEPPMALDAGPPRPLSSLSVRDQSDETDSTTELNETTEGDENDGDETQYSLATNATVAVSGEVGTGDEVVVTASVEDVPVRDAEVRLDGEQVATTDENGRARVRLPDSPGSVTVSVSRGDVSGETTVTIPELTVAVEPTLPVALPGMPVKVRTFYGDDPASNATVRIGDRTARTDLNGTASATLPFQRSATVVVSARGQTGRTTVSGLFVNLLALLGGVAVLLGGLGFGAYRRELGPRRLAGLLLAGFRGLPGLAVAVLFGLADRLEWAGQTISEAVRELLAGETTVGELLARFRAWLGERGRAARQHARLPGEPAAAQSAPATDDDSYRTLRQAWHTFLDAVSVRRPAAMTPGELATHAVRQDDLPSDAVATLRDAFRDVEYGARSPGDRLPRVEDAVETIERATRETDPDSVVADADAGRSKPTGDAETESNESETSRGEN
jgi:transglutaminase-like putative cysteine protease